MQTAETWWLSKLGLAINAIFSKTSGLARGKEVRKSLRLSSVERVYQLLFFQLSLLFGVELLVPSFEHTDFMQFFNHYELEFSLIELFLSTTPRSDKKQTYGDMLQMYVFR